MKLPRRKFLHRELTALLADWEAERREKGRAQVRTRLLPGED